MSTRYTPKDWWARLRHDIWKWAVHTFWAVAFIGVFCLLVDASAGPVIAKSKSCAAAGGHFINQPWSADECWKDGQRIFPDGF